MNGPLHEVAARQSEAAAKIATAREITENQYAITMAVVAEVERQLGVTFLTLVADSLADPDTVARVTFDVVLNMAPRAQSIEVVARITPPVREARGSRAV